jgi:hypothetical protein
VITSLLVAPCTVEAGAYAVVRWHYSGALPSQPLVRYGVWEDTRFIGAVVFGTGWNRHMLRPFGLESTEGAELVRVALRAHRTPVSQVVATAVRLLRRASPDLRLLVSYADPAHGHRGGIYQAMNWIYLGRTSSASAYLGADERLRHQRTWSDAPEAVRRVGHLRFALPGKHRYVLPLDRQMRRRVAPLARPYPRLC